MESSHPVTCGRQTETQYRPPGMVDMKLVAVAMLKGPWPNLDAAMPAKDLWKDGPVVVYAIRRLG